MRKQSLSLLIMSRNRYLYLKTDTENLSLLNEKIKSINKYASECVRSVIDQLIDYNIDSGYIAIDNVDNSVSHFSDAPDNGLEINERVFIEVLDSIFKDKDNCTADIFHKYYKLFTLADLYELLSEINESNPKAAKIIKDIYINHDGGDRFFIPLTINVSNKTIGGYVDDESKEVSKTEFIKLLDIFKETSETVNIVNYYKEFTLDELYYFANEVEESNPIAHRILKATLKDAEGRSKKFTFPVNINTVNKTIGVYQHPKAMEVTYNEFLEILDIFKDTSDKPAHYSKGIDTFERMEKNASKDEILGFIKGNIDKYNWRQKGQDIEDYEKIIAYANWAIKTLKGGDK